MGQQSQEETTVIGVRVSQSRREELEQYAEENDFDSVPALFRRAVSHEMSDEYGPLTQRTTPSDSGASGEVAGELRRLKAEITELREEIHASSGVGPDQDTLTHVFDALEEGESNAKTKEEIAEEAGVSVKSVGLSIAKLEEETGVIGKLSQAEIPQYYKE